MLTSTIPLAKEIDRVPSATVPLDHAQEQHFQRLMEPLIMVDVHVHPMVLPEDMEQLTAYLRANDYQLGLPGSETRRVDHRGDRQLFPGSGQYPGPVHGGI